ncbi:MAG: hypothetical protein IJH39_04460 [Clostridia bacterium]|nr:hypothetical protein [Clostridia bacterium]
MQQINQYIIEKLHLNQDLELSAYSNYNKGDICLEIEYDTRNDYAYFNIIKIDELNIEKKKLSIIELPYTNHNGEGRTDKYKLKILKRNPPYLRIDAQAFNHSPEFNMIIINHEESIELLEYLLDNNMSFDISKYIGGNENVIRAGFTNKCYDKEDIEKLLKKVNDKFK